jgi:adenosylcobinamide-GDP ribazoletransferase
VTAAAPAPGLLDGWRLAVGTLSALRVAPPTRVDREVARAAMLLAPLAVLPLGTVVAVVCRAGSELGLPSLATGLLAVAALVLGTRALHVDGLSDTADGLTASYDPARSLAVMRTGASGPAGGVAVLLVLGLQAVGFASLAARDTWQAALLAGLAVCVSRCALLLTCVRGVPGARAAGPDGTESGLGGVYVGTVPRAVAVVGWAAAAVLVALLAAAAGVPAGRGALACALALVVVGLLLHRTVRRFGGVTGDVYGAAIELSLAALLVVLS